MDATQDQTLKARVYRVVNGNRHKQAKDILHAIQVSFRGEHMPTVLKIVDEIIAKESEALQS
jgi:hypothetical protein